MEEPRDRDLSATQNVTTRAVVVLKVVVLSGVLVLAVAVALYSRTATTHVGDSYGDSLPFRPRVIYSGSSITVVNTETAPYSEVQLTLFAGRTACRISLGTIDPGAQVSASISDCKFDDGTSFDGDSSTAKLLEVRARFRDREVHRDLPPPR